jgi:all-trans-8'-apo-beta-carotenal 15,15'-oxygenase
LPQRKIVEGRFTIATMPPSQAIEPNNAWFSAFTQPIQAFPLQQLGIQSGAVPTALRGSLYRNGPSLFERSGERIIIAIQKAAR